MAKSKGRIILTYCLMYIYFGIQIIIVILDSTHIESWSLLFALISFVLAILLFVYQDKHRENIFIYLEKRKDLNKEYQSCLDSLFSWGKGTQFAQIYIKNIFRRKYESILDDYLLDELDVWQIKRSLWTQFIFIQFVMIVVFGHYG
ncbi:hypothetical protein KAU32_13210 [bacterium]|nr:hypothetical protein [bacterium]